MNLKQSGPSETTTLRTDIAQFKRLCFTDEASGNVSDEELEKPTDYNPGGFHPIHTRDQLSGGRYRVIHKLGHGGHGIVWLCVD